MPGINVTTAVRTGPVGTTDIVSGQAFMIGATERGPVDEPLLLRSFQDYTTYYGNYQANSLYMHAKTFFDEGGSRLYVRRAHAGTAASATVGSLALNDSASSATMIVEAKTPGPWSANLTVQVQNNSDDSNIAAGSFRILIRLDGELLLSTRDLVDVSDAINVINSSSVNHLIEASDDATSSNNPDSLAATALSTGVAPAPTDTTIAEDLVGTSAGAVSRYGDVAFSPNLKSGAVLAPENGVTAVWAALRDHAVANNRIAICDFSSGDSAATARSAAAAYYSDSSAHYMAFYWPYVKVPVPNSSELATGTSALIGSTLTIAPSSYAAAARARAVQEATGPWRAGAGQISSAKTITALAQDVTAATGDIMDNARVNALRKVGTSIRVYGARSVSNDETNWRYITQRDTLNYITVGVADRMEQYLFETVDARGNLFGRIRGAIKAFLEPIRVAGGLFEAYDDDGVLLDPGYNVTVNSTNNPTSQLATGLVKADVGVRVSGVADLINITITKSNLSAPVI